MPQDNDSKLADSSCSNDDSEVDTRDKAQGYAASASAPASAKRKRKAPAKLTEVATQPAKKAIHKPKKKQQKLKPANVKKPTASDAANSLMHLMAASQKVVGMSPCAALLYSSLLQLIRHIQVLTSWFVNCSKLYLSVCSRYSAHCHRTQHVLVLVVLETCEFGNAWRWSYQRHAIR
jgi:hypothetical protein